MTRTTRTTTATAGTTTIATDLMSDHDRDRDYDHEHLQHAVLEMSETVALQCLRLREEVDLLKVCFFDLDDVKRAAAAREFEELVAWAEDHDRATYGRRITDGVAVDLGEETASLLELDEWRKGETRDRR